MPLEAPAFWYPPPGTGMPWPARLLAPFGGLYAAIVAGKARRARPARAALPVLCVGNLTLGGTGKTPLALALARRLAARGARPVFLTRGYGGREKGPLLVDVARHAVADVGDEALLLARVAPTIVARDRVAGASLAATQGDVIVMDDGHQNFSLAKALALVVVDTDVAFGNGLVFPAGPLRERAADGFRRADAVVLMGEGPMPSGLAGFGGKVLRARLEPTPPARALAGARVVAFAGIGRPEKAFATLEALGAEVVARHPLADHAVPGEALLRRLAVEAERLGARLVATEKDIVRLSPTWRPRVESFGVEARLADEGALDALLDQVLTGATERRLQSPADAIKPA